jgi:hypothetical protein
MRILFNFLKKEWRQVREIFKKKKYLYLGMILIPIVGKIIFSFWISWDYAIEKIKKTGP